MMSCRVCCQLCKSDLEEDANDCVERKKYMIFLKEQTFLVIWYIAMLGLSARVHSGIS